MYIIPFSKMQNAQRLAKNEEEEQKSAQPNKSCSEMRLKMRLPEPKRLFICGNWSNMHPLFLSWAVQTCSVLNHHTEIRIFGV